MKKRSILILIGAGAVILVIILAAAAGGAFAYQLMQTRSARAFSPLVTDTDEEEGILIASVLPDSPAAEAGLVRGDILLTIDGEPVNDFSQLQEILDGKEAGEEVEITVLHGDEERTMTATLSEEEEYAFLGIMPCGRAIAGERYFFRVRPWGEDQAAMMDGAYIAEVTPDSPADKAGLKKGDRILSVNGQEVGLENDLADLISAHEPGDEVELEVTGAGEEEPRTVTVTLGENPEDSEEAFLGVHYMPMPSSDTEKRVPFEIPNMPHRRFQDKDLPFAPLDLPEGVNEGVILIRLSEGGPASEAGLQENDLISAIDGEAVKEPKDLQKAIQAHQPGDTVTLTVYRSGEDEAIEIKVELGEDPQDEGKAYLGVQAMGLIKFNHSGDGLWHFDFKFPEWLPFDEPPAEITPPEPHPGTEV